MAPRPRGELSDAQRRKISKAAKAVDDAEAAYRAVVLAAMEAGASFAEVSKATGLSTNTLQRWKREAGVGTAP
jgi:transposase-like protein